MTRTAHLVATATVWLAFAAPALADPMAKEACVDAHSRGQDAREQGKLSLARKLFLSCAQSSCPGLVQSDCAKFANDLDAQQPTITFAARDDAGNDLPDTTVYVDDLLVVTRLDDGRPHDADPGRHVVKFSNAGRDQVVTIVLNAGEKSRAVVAKFASPVHDTPAAPPKAPAPVVTAPPPVAAPVVPLGPPRPLVTSTVHPLGAKLTVLVGGVALLTGGGLAIVGAGRVPTGCSASTHTCTVAPGDPALHTASSALKLRDAGITIGGIGAAALIGGLVWYFAGGHEEREDAPGLAATPWVSPTGAGIALSGRL